MSKPVVRCRCGHQILAKEVLRTDLYERRVAEGSTREFIYIKFRCQRCKRLGEAFVPESRWDRSALEPEANEMTAQERDLFLDEAPISTEEILDFHRHLESLSSVGDLSPRHTSLGDSAGASSLPATDLTSPDDSPGGSPSPSSSASGTRSPNRSIPDSSSPSGLPPDDPLAKLFRGES